jgi:hypothetical protein
VQVKLNDTDSRRGSLGVVQVDHAIADACLSLGSQLPAPHLYLASALTIAAAADTFVLPTAAQSGYVSLTQYAGDIRIRLVGNRNTFLTKRTVEELDALREGAPTSYQGRPSDFALWEEMDDDVQGRCYPRAKEAEPCDLFVSLVPDDIRDAADVEAANVRFSRYGATALVFHTAALIIAQLPKEELALRKLNPNVASLWIKEAAVLLYNDEVRRHNNEAIGRVQRWVG